ncbi:MAG: hypothetical protein R2762_02930 [Bryobacteraceae bacterium]
MSISTASGRPSCVHPAPAVTGLPALIPASAALFFAIWFGGGGLSADFTADDAMNMHRAWSRPWIELVQANLIAFSPYYRPAGGAFYRILYETVGLDPLPYRVLCHALLLANLVLLHRLARNLAASPEAASAAVLFGAHHAGFIDFHYNTGTVYDLLCYCFYGAGLSVYVAGRRGGALSRQRLAAVAILYMAALNSKEIAVTFPVALLAYEFVFQRKPRAFGPAALFTAFLLPYVYYKLSPMSTFYNVGGYRIELTVARYWANTTAFLDRLFYLDRGAFSPYTAALLYLSMASAACLLRSRPMRWSAIFILVSPLPVSFIPARGVFAYYVPLIGWCVYAGALAEAIRTRLVGNRVPALAWFALLFAGLFIAHTRTYEPQDHPPPAGTALRQLRDLRLPVGPQSRILFLRDRFHTDEWTPYFLVQLLYGSRTIAVDRVKMRAATEGSPPTCSAMAEYDFLLDDDGASIARVGLPASCR